MHLEERVIWSTNSMMAAVDMINESDAVMFSYPRCMAEYFCPPQHCAACKPHNKARAITWAFI